MTTTIIGPPDGYCDLCYGEAKKHGRAVRKTDLNGYDLCGLCEQRMRNGLVQYSPANGTEFDYFLDRCFRCRHYIDDLDNPQPGRIEPPFTACTWGVLDRLHVQQVTSDDHISRWFDPDDLSRGCPATCKRFTPKDDEYGHLRDPQPPDAKGQMFLECGDIPVERVPLTVGASAG